MLIGLSTHFIKHYPGLQFRAPQSSGSYMLTMASTALVDILFIPGAKIDRKSCNL